MAIFLRSIIISGFTKETNFSIPDGVILIPAISTILFISGDRPVVSRSKQTSPSGKKSNNFEEFKFKAVLPSPLEILDLPFYSESNSLDFFGESLNILWKKFPLLKERNVDQMDF